MTEPALNAELERVTILEWRCVNAQTAGIGYVATEREHGRNARFNAEGWLETLGPKYHLELWERTYYVTPSEYRRLHIDGSPSQPKTPEEWAEWGEWKS